MEMSGENREESNKNNDNNDNDGDYVVGDVCSMGRPGKRAIRTTTTTITTGTTWWETCTCVAME